LVRTKDLGYLDPDTTISDSFRDLHTHHAALWSAMQGSMRRMVDNFDPEEIEELLEARGMLDSFPGVRSAKLWQAYQDRWKMIASAAEQEFLGEMKDVFKDIYQNDGGYYK
ncbi:MAG: type VI secretion system-associated FHA domain protein, partial [Pseudomonadota bacterium]